MTQKTLRRNSRREGNIKAFTRLVEDIIAHDPFEFEGHVWARRSQAEWAEMSGRSVASIRRWIGEAPFVRERIAIDEKQVTLLRVGEAGPKSPRHVANIMAKQFNTKTGRRPSDRDFGCLVGLAQEWPDDLQPAIFNAVLNGWDTFAAVAWADLENQEDQGGPAVTKRYFKFPSITFIRRCPTTAVQFYVDQCQAAGEAPPAAIAVFQDLAALAK